jgi:hypothetical protein
MVSLMSVNVSHAEQDTRWTWIWRRRSRHRRGVLFPGPTHFYSHPVEVDGASTRLQRV